MMCRGRDPARAIEGKSEIEPTGPIGGAVAGLLLPGLLLLGLLLPGRLQKAVAGDYPPPAHTLL
jgi:hypothetical protein